MESLERKDIIKDLVNSVAKRINCNMSEEEIKGICENFDKYPEDVFRIQAEMCYKNAEEYQKKSSDDSVLKNGFENISNMYKNKGDFYMTLHAFKINDHRFDPLYQQNVVNMVESAKDYWKLMPFFSRFKKIDWEAIQVAAGMGDWGPYYQIWATMKKMQYGKDSVLYTTSQKEADTYVTNRDQAFMQQLEDREEPENNPRIR